MIITSRFVIVVSVFLLFLLSLSAPLQAQIQTESSASQTARDFARSVARSCLRGWESQQCLEALSGSALVLTANYAAALEKAKKTTYTEQLKNHCAASTAAMEGHYPAEAMNSAFTECANTIYDISEASGIPPDLSHYQILVGGVLCLSGQPQCASIEQGLRQRK